MSAVKAMADSHQPKTWASRARDNALLSAELESETDLFNCLRTRILRINRVPAFTMGQVWAMDRLCVEETASYHVVVYLFFEAVEDINAGWERLRASLAVNATAYHASPDDGNPYIVLLFNAVSPLVGPMTFGEAQRAVQHYLGCCSTRVGDNLFGSSPEPEYITVELVEQSSLHKWLDQRHSAISATVKKGFVLGSGFRCKTPCVSLPAQETEKKAGRDKRQQERYIEL